jgi:hypothetical protein
VKIQQLSQWLVRVVNYDFCPSLNGMVYWLKEPIGWVVCAIVASLLVGLCIGPQGYILAFSFLALLVLGLIWPWVSMKGIRCYLECPDRRVEENQELGLVFRVKNFWPLPVFGLMVQGEFLQESDESEPVAFALRRVGAWSESEFRILVTPRRRGRLPTGEVSVTSGFPFGLLDVSKQVDGCRPTLVWPACVSLDGFPVSDSTRFSLQGALRDRAGNDGDSIGVRLFRIGDRLRNIHWAQSARSQKLMVRERQSIASTGATVLLDLSPSEHEGRGVDSSFEWAIRIAASICSHLHEAHSPIRVVSFGLPNQSQLYEDNRNGVRPLLDFLANLPTQAKALSLVDEAEASAESEKRESETTYSFNSFGDDHLFVVASNQSARVQSLSSRDLDIQVTPVIVDADGFKTEDEPHLKIASRDLPSAEIRSSNTESILIETPELASDCFAHGWNRSFSDAG